LGGFARDLRAMTAMDQVLSPCHIALKVRPALWLMPAPSYLHSWKSIRAGPADFHRGDKKLGSEG
jgi:hypothetical protein